MNATKRKFNALIQGLGTRSQQQPETRNKDGREASPSPVNRVATTKPSAHTNDLPPAPNVSWITAELLSKRRRVSPLVSAMETSGRSAALIPGAKTTITNITLKKWSPGDSIAPDKEAQLRFFPADRDQLIRRLATFQELTEWTPKPDRLNEIEWAKRGWVCHGKERVRCTLCNGEVVVSTKADGDGDDQLPSGHEVEEALVDKFSELVVDGHELECLWRKRGCDDSLLRLPVTTPQVALPSLRQRYDELCERSPFLPYMVNLRLPASLDVQTIKDQLPATFFTKPPARSTAAKLSTELRDVALALAMTGWQGLTNAQIGSVPNTASCATCLRRLGLWLFKSKEVDEATGAVVVPAPMDHLEPLREHRFYCPWRNAAAQRNSGSKADLADSKPGWEVLTQTIRNAARLRMHAETSTAPRKGHGRNGSSLLSITTTPTNAQEQEQSALSIRAPTTAVDEENDEESTESKDKARWARLRRVKSLFDTKGARKLRNTLSRPGTASSNRPQIPRSPTVMPSAPNQQ